MRLVILPLFVGFSLLFTACVTQPYLKEHPALIIFKTPTFKYADMGFLYENKEEVKVEIYGAGQAIMALKISNTHVCMSLFECMSKDSFNARVLSDLYPTDILEHIFRGKKIWNGQGLKQKRDGFTQHITKKGKYNIYYSVLNNKITFHDKMNTILIKVKKQ